LLLRQHPLHFAYEPHPHAHDAILHLEIGAEDPRLQTGIIAHSVRKVLLKPMMACTELKDDPGLGVNVYGTLVDTGLEWTRELDCMEVHDVGSSSRTGGLFAAIRGNFRYSSAARCPGRPTAMAAAPKRAEARLPGGA